MDAAAGGAGGLTMGSVAAMAGLERGVGTLVLSVIAAELQSISITASNQSIGKGQQQQFTATGTYSDGKTTDSRSLVTWSASDTNVATFNLPGVASGIGVGSTNITAALGGVTSNPPPLTLSVGPAVLASISITASNQSIAKGQQQQFTATG